MNVAPDQTIVLGLQIFLDHRSLSSINQKVLMTPPSETWSSPKMLPVHVELYPACQAWAWPSDGDDDDDFDGDDDCDDDDGCDDDGVSGWIDNL